MASNGSFRPSTPRVQWDGTHRWGSMGRGYPPHQLLRLYERGSQVRALGMALNGSFRPSTHRVLWEGTHRWGSMGRDIPTSATTSSRTDPSSTRAGMGLSGSSNPTRKSPQPPLAHPRVMRNACVVGLIRHCWEKDEIGELHDATLTAPLLLPLRGEFSSARLALACRDGGTRPPCVLYLCARKNASSVSGKIETSCLERSG